MLCFMYLNFMIVFFFFNDTATTEIYTLSLHDALPISTDELAFALTPPEPGPDRQSTGSLGRGEHLVERSLDGLEDERLEHRERLRRSRDGDVTSIRAKGRPRAERCGSGHAASAPDDEYRPGGVLVVAVALARDPLQELGAHQRVPRGAVLEPDVRHDDVAGTKAARADDEAGLEPVHRDRHLGLDRVSGHLARRGVDA